MKHFSIAIDGPAGAGKSTIAKALAKQLSYIYVDTGAMYRAMALFFLRKGISPDDNTQIATACLEAEVTIEYENGEQVVLLNGENVNGLIRTEEVSRMTSATSVNKVVRMKLVDLQRKLAEQADVVMDGRDIGTYVLPEADVKVYLTASVEERARRRFEEQKARGVDCDIKEIEENIKERDERDMTRDFAPLRKAEDAVYLDCSDMTPEEVISALLILCEK